MDRRKMTKAERFYWELRGLLPILTVLAGLLIGTVILPNLFNPLS